MIQSDSVCGNSGYYNICNNHKIKKPHPHSPSKMLERDWPIIAANIPGIFLGFFTFYTALH
ncbi:hypothetical protein GBP32_01960 [Pediococcus pentosaceus]|nr:hypothetical protein GBP32_01960 [Pediococcus pentosaceus]